MTDKQILPSLRSLPAVDDAIRSVEKAVNAYIKAGGTSYGDPGNQRMLLAVNVKIHRKINHAPEIRTDKSNEWYEYHQQAFWEQDLRNDEMIDKKHGFQFTAECSGRSGGWCVFTDDQSVAAAEFYSGYTRSAGGFTIGRALYEFDRNLDLETESKEAADAIIDVCKQIVPLFKAATEMVEYVKEMKQYRIDAYEGRIYDELEHGFVDSYCALWFDLDNCSIRIRNKQATICWPQHKRVFKDRPDTEVCSNEDEGAFVVTKTLKGGKEGMRFERNIDEFTPRTFKIKVESSAKLAEMIYPVIAEIRRLASV